MSSHTQHHDSQIPEDEYDDAAMLSRDEAAEEYSADEDTPMYSDDAADDPSAVPIDIQDDSIAHFAGHTASIFAIAAHPAHPSIIATGGGDDLAYVWDSAAPRTSSHAPSATAADRSASSVAPLAQLPDHADSVSALAFTLPRGRFLCMGGLDGQVRAWRDTSAEGSGRAWALAGAAREVDEVNWVAACPAAAHPDVVALGAADGSVWVYALGAVDGDAALAVVAVFALHTAACTAGAWTSDGRLLATVAEDASLYVWDVWGEAAAAGVLASPGGNYTVGLTAEDERFRVDGGLYSIAISPSGGLCAVGGADGMIRIVGLPRFASETSALPGSRGTGTRGKAGGKGASGSASAGQAGQILASLQAQSDSVESLAFSDPPLTVLAAASVDGSIVLFDAAHNFAVKRKIENAHEEEAIIKVEFVKAGQGGTDGWLLTSCGNDGVVRRWDCRGTTAADNGLVEEWRGHQGGGEGGGVLGFVQSHDRIVTAGDDGIALVFQTS